MIRFILHLAIVNILSYTAYSGGMIWKALKGLDNGMLVEDVKDRPLVLISNEWQLNWAKERNPQVEFLSSPPEITIA